MVEPGRRNLGERYELAQLIASGGMGQVWRGTDVLLGRPVAVKVLRSEYTGDPTFLARFRAEAQHAAALSHPNIACVFDYGEVVTAEGETLAYLVMELVDGEPLSAVLRREGRLDATSTLSILEQTAAALGEAHRSGLVHRDVKPGNILVRPDGSVKITDFGIAWSAGSVPLTRTGQVIGTPQYLSPEQAEGHLATPASDVYALGLVGYECLTGHPAFDGDNAVTIALKQLRQDPEPLPAELPGGVRTLIRRALAKDPAARMADGAAFVAAIEDTRAGRPLPVEEARPTVAAALPAAVDAAVPPAQPAAAPRPRRSPPVPARSRASSLLVPLIALLLGAAAAAAVFFALSGPSPSPTAPAAQTRGSEQFVLDEADYLGRPVGDVATQLSSLGLTVQRHEDITDRVPAGTVTRVSPAGEDLSRGDDVHVWFAVAPPDDEDDDAPVPLPAPGTVVVEDPRPAGEAPAAPPTSAPVTTAPVTSAAPTGSASDTPSSGGTTAPSTVTESPTSSPVTTTPAAPTTTTPTEPTTP
ncbi:serine/threonine-protein kinase [Blastococcus sp. SYSU D00820]